MGLLLEQAGAHVLRAFNGEEALAVIQAGRVDVMVCDQNMPVMDGKTLLLELKAIKQSVPTLLFVNGFDDENMCLLSALNVRRLLSKPIQPASLIEAVSAVLADATD